MAPPAFTLVLPLHCLLLLKSVSVAAFAPSSLTTGWKVRNDRIFSLASAPEDDEQEKDEEPTLLIGKDLDKELKQFKSKYPTSEADFLAAARKRADEKRESVNSLAKDEDWNAVAEQRKDDKPDDWENALEEAGNVDSQILLPDLPTEDADEDGEEPEPQLLLF
mmetsp:Transcript_21142/g.31359  ORF Transcript_21142/g.31359 Transcript_21142/m.31359 type:complete len:164 (+) Transcript_21142:155-646(+)|eukprot:CAMPEP_0194228156 /NCGR_PEP_ID=MMETSP0156-20130528/43230_1 /TAXON_ID=33649 /ORGANISM="Thalassionema nitzschioides, Strain L26-B" /LENGTH=163 /DNA_ID=CAMNT_0038960663 /DNA_START=99 /DNA_END=593 /DNA_ORIENTATION=+